ncbi:MAG: ParB/RepB/Spo0J family partition protein [Armatimonadetes bacterium]|nr:ParB/RepB/Spo0J family partition protein [Armatimonadota bacterium]
MERRGLGKGLGALIPGAERGDRQGGPEIELQRISANPYQPRETFSDEKFQELVNSVRVHGILQPIVVRPKGDGNFELVAGERRFRAANAAGLSRIPAVVRELTNEQSLQVALIENLQREDINAVEAANAYKRLAEEFSLSQEDLAFSLGKSRSSIANTIRLLNLPEVVLEHLRIGRISEGHARAILSVDSDNAQIEVCDRVMSRGLSVRESERLAREWSKSRMGKSSGSNVSRETLSREQDPNMLAIEARLREVFGTKVNLVRNKERGRIEIEFYSDDDMERILLLLAGA